MKRVVAALWLRIRSNASLFWRWFRYWRKRYMWLRLAILVLIFAQPVYGVFRPTIRELVVIAMKGIEAAKLGPRLYARAYEFQEKKQLQAALRAKFDANGDGLLSRAEARKLTAATDLAEDEATGSGLDVELESLVEASHKTGLLSRVVGATDVRRQTLNRAMQEREAEHVALWREVEPMLDATRNDPAEWLRWETWKQGLKEFRVVLSFFVGLVPGPYFAGILPPTDDPMEYDFFPRAPGWRGYIGWAVLVAAVAISVRRYGRGEELRRRFEEDPELALARCPVCKTPTKQYGMLEQHRWARAWATGAVVLLAALAVGSVTDRPAAWTVLGTAGIPAAFMRWFFWPREVHACHQRRYLPLFGFVVSTVLVAALASYIALFGMRTLNLPRRTVVMVGSSGMMRPSTRMQPVVRTEPAARAAVISVPARAPGSRLARGGERRTDRVARPARAARDRRPRGRAGRAPERR